MLTTRMLAFAILSLLIACAQPILAQEVLGPNQRKTIKGPPAAKNMNKKGMVGLNPQPEPPSRKKGKGIKPSELRGLNPQPEPPSATAK